MNNKIFLPKKIKVGFNKRKDTYTGLLGYVIYFDGKKWRKEYSWENWRQKVTDTRREYNYEEKRYVEIPIPRDESLAPQEHTNEPLEGFVLNRKAGGYSSGWNHRQSVCRVYDPRGFEFEITIENLLYILDNTNSIVGKGLEGKFIYGWSGKDLVLIPESAPEYSDMVEFTSAQGKKLTKADMVVGCTYKTKKMDNLVYLGFFPTHETKSVEDGVETYAFYGYTRSSYTRPKYKKIIVTKNKHWYWNVDRESFEFHTGYVYLASRESDKPVPNYAELMQEIEHHRNYNPIDNEREDEFWLCDKVPEKDKNGRFRGYDIDYFYIDGVLMYCTGMYRDSLEYYEEKYRNLDYKVKNEQRKFIKFEPTITGEELVAKLGGIYKRVKFLKNGKEQKY